MFKKIRDRLLINSIIVFTLVLASSALVVRLVFVQNLQQQQKEQLIVLGQGVVAEAELKDGKLTVEDEFLAQTLVSKQRSFEWFDTKGKSVERMGDSFSNTPFDPEIEQEISEQNPPIQSVTLPIVGEETRALIGYVRISQTMGEFDETVWLLDIGLGVGVMAAVVLSSVGILWLNRQAMQPIEESFERLKQFTADASHELRSPLMAISSNVEVSLKYSEGMRADDREAMEAVASAANQMASLTEDLLLIARTDKSPNQERIRVDLSDLLTALVRLYTPQAKQQQIELTAAIAANLWIRGDAAQLSQAFTNLLQNAIRYTPAGGKVNVRARQIGQQVQIKVRDTGVGIAKENKEKVFERFWRSDKARKYDNQGSGLGLSITQNIVYSHNGEIEVMSELGAGSCFTVTFSVGR